MTITTILMMTLFLTLTHSHSLSTETSHALEEKCTESRLLTLAACGCYVQATITDPSKEEIGLCNRQFGTDLQSLKPRCSKFENEDDVVDENAVTEAIIEVQQSCFWEMENGGDEIVESERLQHTERILPYVVLAIIAFYPAKAY